MNLPNRVAAATLAMAGLTCWTSPASSYQVWLGVACAPSSAAKQPLDWAETAELVEGVNLNDAGTPSPGEKPASRADWQTIFGSLQAAKANGMLEMARSTAAKLGGVGAVLDIAFAAAERNGTTIQSVMFYDNSNNDTLYEWTDDDVAEIKAYLKDINREDVRLYYDVRNNSPRSQSWAGKVDGVLIEASYDVWMTSGEARLAFLKSYWADPATATKPIIFQVPARGETEGGPNNFQKMRRLVQWLGSEAMSWEFLQSPRVIFLPTTYSGTGIRFHPETIDDGSRYDNTTTGIALSLIEQRRLFEGRDRKPTEMDADNDARGGIDGTAGAGGMGGEGGREAMGGSGAGGGANVAGSSGGDVISTAGGTSGRSSSNGMSGESPGVLTGGSAGTANTALGGVSSGCQCQLSRRSHGVGLSMSLATAALLLARSRRRHARSRRWT